SFSTPTGEAPLKLECKIRRPGGSEVTMPNGEGEPSTVYHFKPIDPTRADSPHVCEVDNDAHLSRFIAAAPECYVPFRSTVTPKIDVPKPAPKAPDPVPPPLADEAAADKKADDDADTNNDGRIS